MTARETVYSKKPATPLTTAAEPQGRWVSHVVTVTSVWTNPGILPHEVWNLGRKCHSLEASRHSCNQTFWCKGNHQQKTTTVPGEHQIKEMVVGQNSGGHAQNRKREHHKHSTRFRIKIHDITFKNKCGVSSDFDHHFIYSLYREMPAFFFLNHLLT